MGLDGRVLLGDCAEQCSTGQSFIRTEMLGAVRVDPSSDI